MNKNVSAAILERDEYLRIKVGDCLSRRHYRVEHCAGVSDLKNLLKAEKVSLVVLGEGYEGESFMLPLRMTVTLSPMTSVIVLADLTEAELHEKTEGYGILGAASRRDPESDLDLLCRRFEEIESMLVM